MQEQMIKNKQDISIKIQGRSTSLSEIKKLSLSWASLDGLELDAELYKFASEIEKTAQKQTNTKMEILFMTKMILQIG